MKKKLFSNYLMIMGGILVTALTAGANDAVYYANGSLLVPIGETDIAVASEVLTISLNDDGYARVEVDYEFDNSGPSKVVKMGFEAVRPYNTEDDMIPQSEHPYIHDFTVTMNGTTLSYTNAIVDVGLLDKPYVLPDDTPEEFARYSYAYCFEAPFKKGKNTVRHTYRYKISSGIARTFIVPYWLKPATRWRGGSIGDFTLRIVADNTAKYFSLPEELFSGAEFKVTKGAGKVRHNTTPYDTNIIEITLRNGMVEWHKRNFSPTDDMEITSMDAYTFFSEDYKLGTFYDRSQNFVSGPYEMKKNMRIARNLPYASRGYVFKDKSLNKYFSQFWWYMPDPSWKISTEDFTPREWRLINEGD